MRLKNRISKRVKSAGKGALFGAIALIVLFVATIILSITLPTMILKRNNEDGRITTSNDSDSYPASDTEQLSASDLKFIPAQKINGGDVTEAVAEDPVYDEEDILLDGTYIESAEAQTLEAPDGTKYVVSVKFNDEGAEIFRKATKEMAQSQEWMCVLFNGEVISIPTVTSEIADGKAVISGFMEFEEAEKLAAVVSK